MTTRGFARRIISTTCFLDASSFVRCASGILALSRSATPSVCAARSASAARVAASPRVPISPCVRSRMPTRCPARTARASVPPQVSSTSSRCAAIASKSTCSLIPECLDWIELRRACRGCNAEDQADEDRCGGRNRCRHDGYRRAEREQPLQDFTHAYPQRDTDDAAQQRQGGCLDQELPQDRSARRAERFAQADLP